MVKIIMELHKQIFAIQIQNSSSHVHFWNSNYNFPHSENPFVEIIKNWLATEDKHKSER